MFICFQTKVQVNGNKLWKTNIMISVFVLCVSTLDLQPIRVMGAVVVNN